jgi:small subunit ribosomal protein S16
LVKIRLTRLGKHKDPFYRIVATDSRTKRDGAYIALLGTFEPSDGIIKIKKDLVIDFLIKGAQPTETILNILKNEGIWAEYIKNKKIVKKHQRKLTKKRYETKKNKKIKPKTLAVKPDATSESVPVQPKVDEIKQ